MAIIESLEHLEAKLSQKSDSLSNDFTKRTQLLQARIYNLEKSTKVDETIGAEKDYKTLQEFCASTHAYIYDKLHNKKPKVCEHAIQNGELIAQLESKLTESLDELR